MRAEYVGVCMFGIGVVDRALGAQRLAVTQPKMPDLHDIPVLQGMALNFLTVDECAVCTAQINNVDGVCPRYHECVMPADETIVERQVVSRVPAHHQARLVDHQAINEFALQRYFQDGTQTMRITVAVIQAIAPVRQAAQIAQCVGVENTVQTRGTGEHETEWRGLMRNLRHDLADCFDHVRAKVLGLFQYDDRLAPLSSFVSGKYTEQFFEFLCRRIEWFESQLLKDPFEERMPVARRCGQDHGMGDGWILEEPADQDFLAALRAPDHDGERQFAGHCLLQVIVCA